MWVDVTRALRSPTIGTRTFFSRPTGNAHVLSARGPQSRGSRARRSRGRSCHRWTGSSAASPARRRSSPRRSRARRPCSSTCSTARWSTLGRTPVGRPRRSRGSATTSTPSPSPAPSSPIRRRRRCRRGDSTAPTRLTPGVRGATRQLEEIRRSQNWIGGSRPDNASFVPPVFHSGSFVRCGGHPSQRQLPVKAANVGLRRRSEVAVVLGGPGRTSLDHAARTVRDGTVVRGDGHAVRLRLAHLEPQPRPLEPLRREAEHAVARLPVARAG